jgi:hypothetical protein
VIIKIQCIECKRLKITKGVRCEAFPEGIPDEIITGEHDHTEPYPGDNGIRFEPLQPGK